MKHKIAAALLAAALAGTGVCGASAANLTEAAKASTLKLFESEPTDVDALRTEFEKMLVEIENLRAENQALKEELETMRRSVLESVGLGTEPTPEVTETEESAAETTTEAQTTTQEARPATEESLKSQTTQAVPEQTEETSKEEESEKEPQTEGQEETSQEAAEEETGKEAEEKETEEEEETGKEDGQEEKIEEEEPAQETVSEQETEETTESLEKETDPDLLSMEPIEFVPTKEAGEFYNDPSFRRVYIGTDLVVTIQIALNESGYYCGAVDGVIGTGTKNQIRSFQTNHGLTATGTITDELLQSLLGLDPPGMADVKKSEQASNVPLKDANILDLVLKDEGRQDGAYQLGVQIRNVGTRPVKKLSFDVAYYDQNGKTLAVDTVKYEEPIPSGSAADVTSLLEGDTASWDVAAAGVTSYTYVLSTPDDYGFTSYEVNLQTGLVQGK